MTFKLDFIIRVKFTNAKLIIIFLIRFNLKKSFDMVHLSFCIVSFLLEATKIYILYLGGTILCLFYGLREVNRHLMLKNLYVDVLISESSIRSLELS